jgi:ketosteroid isomerase-like protein
MVPSKQEVTMRRLMLAAAFCALVSAPSLALDKETVQKEATKFAEAFNRGDMAAVASMYTDGAYLMPPQAEMIRGRDNIQKFWIEMGKQAGDLKLTTLNVNQLGNEGAREIGSFRIMSKGQQPQEIIGKYVIILQKIGDEWKIETDIWNSNQ